MVKAELMCYKISRLNMFNDLQESSQLMLKSSFDCDVTCDLERELAFATLTERLSTADNCFYLNLTLEGTFQIAGVKSEASRKQVHVKCYDGLFPYAAQLISQLAENSGLSGVVLKKQTLKSVNLGERPKSDKIIEFPEKNYKKY